MPQTTSTVHVPGRASGATVHDHDRFPLPSAYFETGLAGAAGPGGPATSREHSECAVARAVTTTVSPRDTGLDTASDTSARLGSMITSSARPADEAAAGAGATGRGLDADNGVSGVAAGDGRAYGSAAGLGRPPPVAGATHAPQLSAAARMSVGALTSR